MVGHRSSDVRHRSSDIGHRVSEVGYRYASFMKRIIALVVIAAIIAVAYKILTAEVLIDES